MINYRNKIIALIILVLFAASNLIPIISVAHDPCAADWEKVKEWQGKLNTAEENLRKIKEKGYLQSIATQGVIGLGAGGLVGWLLGPGILPVASAGAITGMISGGIDHYNEVQAAESEVTYARNTLNSYYESWQRCDTKYSNHTHSASSSSYDLTPSCSDCTDGNPNCSNASIHYLDGF